MSEIWIASQAQTRRRELVRPLGDQKMLFMASVDPLRADKGTDDRDAVAERFQNLDPSTTAGMHRCDSDIGFAVERVDIGDGARQVDAGPPAERLDFGGCSSTHHKHANALR